jgi:hypothetical protein
MKTRTTHVIGGTVLGTLLITGSTAFGQCDTTAPVGAVEQNDPGYCGSDTEVDPNGGCNNLVPVWQDLGEIDSAGFEVVGNVGAWTTTAGTETRDLDWYSFTAPSDGTVTIVFNSSNATTGVDPADFVGFFATNSDDCATLLIEGFLFPCGGEYVANVLEGVSYGMITTVNGFGAGGASDCSTDYLVSMSYEESPYDCGDPSQGACSEPNGTPGCADFACCIAVCEFDSLCCDSEWDSTCADAAIDICGYFSYECNEVAGGPANDCAINPETVTPGIIDFDTTLAETDGPAQPECGSPAGAEQLDKDVWFLYTPTADGIAFAVTCGYLTWDTKVAAYGPYADFGTFDPQALEIDFLACNEDGCTDGTYSSTLTFEVATGNSYLIRIGGYLGENGPGQFELTLAEGGGCKPIAAVLGDNAVDTSGAIGFNLDLTGICDFGQFGDEIAYNVAYYSFTPDTDDLYSLSTCNQADFDTRLAVLTEGCEPTSTIACLDDTDGCAGFTTTLELDLLGGVEYTIAVGGYNAAALGTGTLTISAGPPPDPCEGFDNSCANPDVVTLGDYNITTAPCGDVDYTGFCDLGDFGDELIYNAYFLEFTPDADDTYTVSTCNQAAFDTRIGIQTSCDFASVIACLDDTEGCEGFTTTLSTELTGGVTYYIVIGGYGAGDAGDATVTISGGVPPDPCEGYTNDCSSPEVLPGLGDFPFDNLCAQAAGDRQFDMTGFCVPGDFGDAINWNTYYFEFTAGSDGDYTFSTCGQASFDTRLFVASSCDPSTTIACNDDGTDDAGAACPDFTSNIDVTLTAGTYIVGVGGYAAGNAGTGLLTVLGPEDPDCPGDFNGDGVVDGADLTILLGDWGGSAADLNGDGLVDGADLTILLGNWGDCV